MLGVGKIEDIFNHRGLTMLQPRRQAIAACVDATLDYMKKPGWKGLLFTNLVDTDMLYGHRNDVPGFARRRWRPSTERLPEILRLLGEDGMLILTADHGCDPAFPTTDHTREKVPLLVWGLGLQEGVSLGDAQNLRRRVRHGAGGAGRPKPEAGRHVLLPATSR